jgi:hypothetical protein
MDLEFSGQIFEKYSAHSIKLRPVGAELFHADGQTDMTKLTVAFRNMETRLKRVHYYYIYYYNLHVYSKVSD